MLGGPGAPVTGVMWQAVNLQCDLSHIFRSGAPHPTRMGMTWGNVSCPPRLTWPVFTTCRGARHFLHSRQNAGGIPVFSTISNLLPTLLGCIGLMAVGLDATAPCGPRATRPATTLTDHLSAIVNHIRAIVTALSNRRNLDSGQE